jgi:succinoglycan biosynthesis protein ExoO
VTAAAQPHVSAVVPTYCARACARRAIESALGQTFGHLEVIVVDDASTDGTPGYLEETYQDEPRVRVMRLDRNAGPARARNIGIEAARGEWIALLDADDAWRPQRLERLLARAGDADAVFDNLAGCHVGAEHEARIVFPIFPPQALTIPALLAPYLPRSRYNFGYLKPILRRAFLRERHIAYDERLRTSEDLLLYLTLLLEGARTRMIDEALYVYTVGPAEGVPRLSDTAPRDREVKLALQRIVARDEGRLAPEAASAIEQRIAFLHNIAPISEFYFARKKRNIGRMAFLFARHPSVQREAFGKLMSLLSR